MSSRGASRGGDIANLGQARLELVVSLPQRAAFSTAALLPLLIPSLGAQAATTDVDPGNDELSGVTVDGNCSLQEAITAARPDCEVVSRICTSEK